MVKLCEWLHGEDCVTRSSGLPVSEGVVAGGEKSAPVSTSSVCSFETAPTAEYNFSDSESDGLSDDENENENENWGGGGIIEDGSSRLEEFRERGKHKVNVKKVTTNCPLKERTKQSFNNRIDDWIVLDEDLRTTIKKEECE